MKKTAVILAAVFLAASLIGCESSRAERAALQKAQDFELEDINGRHFKLSDWSGKVIVLNFFATWCPPCRTEMPDFSQIQKEYAGKVGVIGINVGREGLQRVRKFVSDNNLDFTIAIDNGVVSRLYGPMPGIPVTVMIDKDFNIAARYVGLRPKEVFVRDIRQLLK